MQPDNQYDFFMSQTAPAKKKIPLPGGGMSKKQFILMITGAVVILLILITVFASVFQGKPSNAEQLVKVAQQQNELIRISDIALKQAKSNDALNLAITTKLSLRSDQSSLLAALKAQKVTVKPDGGKNSKTDQTLTTAQQNNRFDEAYLEYIQAALVDYQKNLNSAYKTTVGRSLKQTLKVQYQNASILIGVDAEV